MSGLEERVYVFTWCPRVVNYRGVDLILARATI